MPKVIGEIIQNGGEFAVVDANNIRGGVYSVDSNKEMQAIPALRRKAGMLCYVSEEQCYYQLLNGEWKKFTATSAGTGECSCTVDSTLSSTSTNPV